MLPSISLWKAACRVASGQDDNSHMAPFQTMRVLYVRKKKQFCNFADVRGIFCSQVAGQQQGDLTLCLSEVLGSTEKPSQKDQDTRRLVAATAGYISVLYHGRASGMH